MYLLISSEANDYLRENTVYVPCIASFGDNTYFVNDTEAIRNALAALGWISVITEADVVAFIQSNFMYHDKYKNKPKYTTVDC